MEAANISAQEKLDKLLLNKKITEEEYIRLSKAITLKKEPSSGMTEATEHRSLYKNCEYGLIGGLLAGYADYFGTDVKILRTVFLLAYIILCAINGIGLIIVPLYFILCALIPWADKEKAKALQSSGSPRLFMLTIVYLFFVIPAIYAIGVFPSLESTYQSMGIDLWTPLFQETLSGSAVDATSEYQYWLDFHNTMLIPVPIFILILAALTTGFLGIVYATLCREKIRRVYARTMVGFGIAWVLFLIGGTLYPLVTLQVQ